ncbi:hypothetical protein B0H66DRAFT_485811, partial [Apodospora peruviana]
MLPRQLITRLSVGLAIPVVAALTGNEKTIEEVFPALYDLNKPYTGRALGGQNFTRCCLQAVKATYGIVDGKLDFVSPNNQDRFLTETPQDLSNAEFPCGAKYTGDDNGAPLVTVPYHWCADNCGGWQKSVNGDLNQWIIPFVGFILPAAVFCLSVPRRRIFTTPDSLFPNHLPKVEGRWVEFMTIRAAIAASIAFLNTILWVAMVFTAAAPMMLSGLYEAMIDRNVLDAILKNRKWNRIRRQKDMDIAGIKREVHLLYAILVGNISLPPKDEPPLPDQPTAWSDVKRLVETLDPDPSAPKPAGSPKAAHIDKSAGSATRLRLHTMLECQVSFGATVGAPIIGNNDVAHTIAFGEWWMTIPHVAIVAGCLLAGNNPNTLEAIMSGFPHLSDRPDHGTLKKRVSGFLRILDEYFSPVYDSIYQPVWMWERGRNKRLWVEKKLEERLKRLNSKYLEHESDDAKALPDDIPDIDVEDWLYLVLNVIVLLLIPFVLAILTSYHTPLVGLSCRSFTFTLYFLSQFWLGVLWFWDYHRDKHTPFFFRFRNKYYLPTPFALLVTFGLLVSGFTAMVGTFLQILGVYRNCLCKLPIQYWSNPTDVHVILSSNMAESIVYARQYWLSTGIASIVLLVVVCYLGWWYQRHWRMRF